MSLQCVDGADVSRVHAYYLLPYSLRPTTAWKHIATLTPDQKLWRLRSKKTENT